MGTFSRNVYLSGLYSSQSRIRDLGKACGVSPSSVRSGLRQEHLVLLPLSLLVPVL